jgi:hypothetical protein
MEDTTMYENLLKHFSLREVLEFALMREAVHAFTAPTEIESARTVPAPAPDTAREAPDTFPSPFPVPDTEREAA